MWCDTQGLEVDSLGTPRVGWNPARSPVSQVGVGRMKHKDITPMVKALSEVKCPEPGCPNVEGFDGLYNPGCNTCNDTGRKYSLTEPCPGLPRLHVAFGPIKHRAEPHGCCDGSGTRLVSEEVAAIRILECSKPGEGIARLPNGWTTDLGWGTMANPKDTTATITIIQAAAKLEGATYELHT